MQKRTFLRGALSAAFILSTPFILAGCGDEKPAAAAGKPDTAKALGQTKIRVGVTAGPHADIVAKAAEVAKTHGLEVEVVEFSDYVTPDISLNDGALDAAVYQHEPFLRNFNEQKGTKLAVAGHAVVQPMGIYSKRIHALEDIKTGAAVAIPNDPSNGGRALILCEEAGLIKLREGLKGEPLVHDIVENPRGLRFIELEAAQLPLSLEDVDAAFIPMNYVVSSGLSPEKDGFYFERLDAPYALIVIAAREDNVKNPEIATFVESYRSAETAAFVREKFRGTILPSWTTEKRNADDGEKKSAS